MRDPEFERSGMSVLGMPGHIVRRLATESLAAVAHAVLGRMNSAFDHEVQARFCAGFAAQRLRAHRFKVAEDNRT